MLRRGKSSKRVAIISGGFLFLKRLDVSGFKSFAARSVLDFEKGEEVAIVGPNGSGKSNIADAIRWVLGETSYKTVRAKKSEDVIFSGSNGKAKASFARVSMTLDNSDGKAPIDFSEVEISRAVYRDGSSEYLINGKKARLLDVAELLAKSGFGQSTYSVIGQGMVDSMLFYGPAERKVLFDEAAGVRQYEIKREQAIKKLEDTSANVIRIKDILAELSPRAKALGRQAEKAKEKDTVKAELLTKQKLYFASIWDRITVSENEKRSELEKLTVEEEKISAEIADLNTKFNEILGSEQKDGGESEELKKQIADLEVKKDELRQKIFTLKAKMEFAEGALTTKEIVRKIKAVEDELKGLDLAKKQKAKADFEAQINAFDEPNILAQIKTLEVKKDELRQEIFTTRAKMEVGAGELTREEIEARKKEVKTSIEALDEKSQINEKNLKSAEVQKIEAEIKTIEHKISSAREKVSSLSKKLAEFDFGTVSDQVSAILYLQNDFVIKVEEAKDLSEVAQAIEVGKKVSERLKELRREVGEAKEGKVAGLAELQQELEDFLAKKEQLAKQLADHTAEIMKLEFQIKEISGKKFDLEKELGRLCSMAPSDESGKKELAGEIKKLEAQIAKIDTEILEQKEKTNQIQQLKNEVLDVEFEIKHLSVKKLELEAEIERLSALKPAEVGEKQEFETQIEKYETEIKDLDRGIEEARTELNTASNDFEVRSKELATIKDDLTAKQRLLNEYTSEVSNLRVEMAKFDTKKQDLREEIARELGSEAVLADAKVATELDESTARAEIEKLKGKLYAIGEIDPEVESEYKEVGERVEFLSGQLEDLDKAKNDLEKMLSELDGRIKKQFESSFSAISAKFTHFFTLLFGGGTAKLELVRSKDEEDEQERFGIEISAVPPGKKVNSISALSGGERTLTSLALLFAILSVNPAPFCVLDEVDAALDETNTKKFLKIVHELSHSTQFIFISHNRETMKEAGLIYGITMDNSHASKVLSIKLTEAMEVAGKKTVKV